MRAYITAGLYVNIAASCKKINDFRLRLETEGIRVLLIEDGFEYARMVVDTADEELINNFIREVFEKEE